MGMAARGPPLQVFVIAAVFIDMNILLLRHCFQPTASEELYNLQILFAGHLKKPGRACKMKGRGLCAAQVPRKAQTFDRDLRTIGGFLRTERNYYRMIHFDRARREEERA